jgi:hypothetical protein
MMKKTSLLAAVIALGSLTGVAQAAPVAEKTTQPDSGVQSLQKLPIKLPLFVGSDMFIEGTDVVPVTGNGTVYELIPAENGFYIKGLAFGTGYIKLNGVKTMVEVVYHHPGPNFFGN